jgi:hypothetical protein
VRKYGTALWKYIPNLLYLNSHKLIDDVHVIGTDPDSSDTSYETAHTSCSSMKWLIMGYAISTVMVLLFIDKVCLLEFFINFQILIALTLYYVDLFSVAHCHR